MKTSNKPCAALPREKLRNTASKICFQRKNSLRELLNTITSLNITSVHLKTARRPAVTYISAKSPVRPHIGLFFCGNKELVLTGGEFNISKDLCTGQCAKKVIYERQGIKILEGGQFNGAIVGDEVKLYIFFSNKERCGAIWKMWGLEKTFSWSSLGCFYKFSSCLGIKHYKGLF